MPNQLTMTDIAGPTMTTGAGVTAAASSLTLIQIIGLTASIVGIVWGTINIIKALYYFAIWINKTALPWLKSKQDKADASNTR